GYNGTTIKHIASNLGISLGNMTYYFKTKDAIVMDIFVDYINNIYDFIKDKVDPAANSYYRHFFVSIIFYKVILSNPNNKRFFGEIMQKKSFYHIVYHRISDIYRDIIRDYNLRISAAEYERIVIADFGARREVMLSYLSGDIVMPVEDLAIFLLSNTSKLLGVQEVHLYKNSFQAYTVSKKYDYSKIHLLIP
ncbi:MAG: TetR/AcrR family transcriptional regulator, partial [Thermotaleaceae bacterium]